jgi:hypothetical protein
MGTRRRRSPGGKRRLAYKAPPGKLGSNEPVPERLSSYGMDVLSEQEGQSRGGVGMREVEKVRLEQAILHQVEAGSSGLRMSGRERG